MTERTGREEKARTEGKKQATEKREDMLSIRLRRAGTTKKPHYRVVVADSRAWRDGRCVEVLGHYDPRKDPVVVKIDAERAQYWIGKGAQPSDTVRSLLKKQTEAAKATAAK